MSDITLRPYQIEAIDKIASRNGKLLVNAAAGSGKTLTALYLRKKFPLLKKVLVVCPASVKDQWNAVITTTFPKDKSFVARGAYDKKFEKEIINADFVVINYDILFGKKGVQSWTSVLSKAKFDLMIIDESHKLGNAESNRSKCLYNLSLNIRYKVMLTATPLTSNIVGLWGQLHVLDPLKFTDVDKFVNYYAPPVPRTIEVKRKSGATYTHRIWEPGAIRHMDELHKLIDYYCYVISADEVYKHLAGVQRIEVPCVIDDAVLIKEIEKLKNMDTATPHEISVAKEALLRSRMTLGKAKTSIAVSWIKDWLESSDEKIVVFAYHRAVVEEIAEKLGKVAVKFYGGMGDKERESNKSAFINNPEVRVIVMNIDTCTGVDGLNTVSRTCFYAENTSLPGLFDQSEGRVRRANSTYDAYFTYILKADVLDGAILEAMWERKKLFDNIMTGKETEIKLEDDFLDVIKRLKGK